MSSALDAPPSIGRCGPYVLVRRLGAGGMGEIFLAKDPRTGREVAIKRLLSECARDPVFIGMFLDEARLAARLLHPNIGRVEHHGQEGSHYYLVMEPIHGVSLKQLLDARPGRGLPFALACRIVAEVCSALDYAHRLKDELGVPLGVVHRDVSPANVMIAKDGAVKLVDFGLAKARTQLMKTQPGLVKGKFGYLAPEQLGGKIDWRTDLFGLGLILFEALTGRALFNQQTAAETVQAVASFRGPPRLAGVVPGVPPELDEVLASSRASTVARCRRPGRAGRAPAV
ncbi:MAG: serine/threonine protein kinase, partial [Sandaracinaceae bacterium]|nr:serine/threonine protein kinase [Sandaracinaceae bacterium]